MASLYDIPLVRLDGPPASLAEHAGKVLLIVNVASKCGLTPQYEGLENLYRAYRDRGLAVLGFPANDFAGQEPGTDEEIGQFCRSAYGVDFPMFSKIAVGGPDRHPLYGALIAAQPEAAFRQDSKFDPCSPGAAGKRAPSTGTSRSSWSAATARRLPASRRTPRPRTRSSGAPSKPRSEPEAGADTVRIRR